MEKDLFKFIVSISGYIEPALMIFLGLTLISLFYKSKLKKPGGRGFKNIGLARLKGSQRKKIFSFESLVRGALVIAGAGSGKTKSIIEPLITQTVKEKYSGIIYDFKFPSLASYTYREALRYGNHDMEYFYVNFDDLSRSHRCNVFRRVQNSSYAQEYASSFIMNLLPESIKQPDFFLRSATALLTSAILYFSRREKEICTLPHVISFLLHPDTSKVVDIISRDPEAADIVASVKSGLGSDRQTAGVISTLQNSLSLCANPKIFWVLSGDDFNLDLNDPRFPKLLVIGNKAGLINSISPVISLVITVATKEMNESGKAKSILLLDEGPTLYIPNFDSIPATGRENKIATVYCGQDIAQMEERYGEKKSEVLMANLANQFYGKISNPKTAEKVVKFFDKDDVEFESRSQSSTSNNRLSNSTGVTRSLQLRDRVSVTHLRDLNPGEFVATTVDLKDFKTVFPHKSKAGVLLPEITFVTEEIVYQNYLKIKNDVLRLFE